MLRVKLNADLFIRLCQKWRLSETIFSLKMVRKIGKFLLVLCPYLVFSSSLLCQSREVKIMYVIDKPARTAATSYGEH